MGERGPVPARSEERRRANTPDHPIWKLGPDELKQMPFEIDLEPTPPEPPTITADEVWKAENPNERWCKLVRDWYEAIRVDPMVTWMTSADWGALMILLEDLDRELKPQVVGVTPVTYSRELDEDTGDGQLGGDAVYAVVPMKGAKMSAVVNFLKAFGIGEANRLRMQKEVQLFKEHQATIQPGAEEDIVETRLELLQGGKIA